jgi:hypothetical protein
MTPEEYLDYLIQQQLSDASWQPDSSDDEAARLAAAEAVANLNTIEPPFALSERIEARVRSQARLRQNGHAPTLVPGRQTGRVIQLEPVPRPSPARENPPRRPHVRRALIAALSTAAVLLLALLGVSNVAAGSLPGDPLYGVRQFEQQVALSNANSPDARANLLITQLQNALADLQTEVNDGRSDDNIRQALSIVASDTQQSQAAVAALPAGTTQGTAQQSLSTTLQNEQSVLYTLLGRVDWPLRLAFTQQLGALGVAIPTVTQVKITPGPNNTLILKLTGANFAQGAQLTINGNVRGAVTQNTGTTLTATVSLADWRDDDSVIGVMNPDGTAAQKFAGDDQNDGSDDGSDDGHGTPVPGRTVTPGRTPTPGGGDDGDGD